MGNTVRDPQSRRFTYDGENKQVMVETLDANGNPVSTVGEYEYDGDGKRVKKHVPSTGEVTVFVYDAGGKLIGEYSTVAAPQSPKVSYTTADHLGSPRILTDENGATISRRDFMPYGEEIARQNYGTDSIRQKFTTYERDNETDLDFAQARYHDFSLGRFSSPDIPFVDQIQSEPQSWNMYLYVVNNPLKFTDPLGLWKRVPCTSGNVKEECWEAERGDTYETLARDRCGGSVCRAMVWLNMSNAAGLREFFNNQSISPGQVFSLAGWDEFRRARRDELSENIPGPLGGGGMRPPKVGRGGKGLFKEGLEWVKNIPRKVRDKFKKRGTPPLRQQYEDEVAALAQVVDDMHNSGHTIEQIAIRVHGARRNLGIKYKDLTPPELLKKIKKRNLEKYGDELGPSIELLRSRGKSWEDIIESALRPGGLDIDFN